MKIYVASSWRNHLQPGIVHALRRCGHEVYDFRHPKLGDDGFRWQDVGGPATYQHGDKVSAERYREMLAHPRAAEGYEQDIGHVRWCDAVVYVLPCGRSASFEFGYAMGQGKRGYVVAFDDIEPDLMFREAAIIGTMDELFDAFGEPIEDIAAAPPAEAKGTEATPVPPDVHERGWQWRPCAPDTAFAPPFGTIRLCRECGCLVAGGPALCGRCAPPAEKGEM